MSSAPGPAGGRLRPPAARRGREDGAFGGGWIGYLGYSAGGEALPRPGRARCPRWWFGWYDNVLVRDRATGEWFFEALWTDARADALERRFAELAARAAEAAPRAADYEFAVPADPGADGHREAVARAVEYIRQGDIFQANICLRAEAEFAGDPLDAFCQAADGAAAALRGLHRRLRVPGPPSAGQRAGAGRAAVASLSPELFLRRAGAARSRPSRSRAPRGAPPTRPRRPRSGPSSSGSAKNRAENVMIVDLVRNDLSRVCLPGTVTVPDLLGAEPHPGVWHLVSTVERHARATAWPTAT